MIGKNLCPHLALTLVSLWVHSADAERVDICNYQTFQQASGTHCSFTTAPGEWIHVWARYRDTSPGSAYVNLQPFSNSLNLTSNHQGEIIKKIGVQNLTNASVYYSIGGFSPTGDYLDLDVWRDRCNLRANAPSINSDTGEMRIPWAVTTQTQVSTNGYVYVEAWTSDSPSSGNQAINRQWGLAPCINQGNCSHTQVVPLAERDPIPLGHSWLISKIDPSFAHAETNESDNIASVFLDDFFVEKIPAIASAIAPNWQPAAALMQHWFGGDLRAKNQNVTSFDFDLPTMRLSGLDYSWVRNTTNSTRQAVHDAHNEILSTFLNQAARQVLKTKLETKFAANPGAMTLPLSFQWVNGNSINYHKQQIQRKLGQGPYTTTFDATTATLGSFYIYAVPFGTATKTASSFMINVNSVSLHVLDSFDFNGFQPLGCWAEPAGVSWYAAPWSSFDCIFNSDFRYYRRMKARGGDFNIMVPPVNYTIAPAINISIPR